MNETREQILSAARIFVTDLFTHKLDPQFVFHNLDHTEDVAEACSQISENTGLPEEDHFILMLAAWFHDTGYISGSAAEHEEESIRIATKFMEDKNVDAETVRRVISAIRATRMPQSPVTQLEMILCDADLYHLSTEDFKARNQLLKQERESLLGQKISKKDWRKNNIEFLGNHKYFTEFGQRVLEPRKQENILALKKKKEQKKEEIQQASDDAFPYVYEVSPLEKKGIKPEKIVKEEQKNTERGVQTMFRTTSSNHFELSSLADSKANIMISVNAIILSISVTFLIARLPHYPYLIIPTMLLLASCLCAIVFAILSTRPTINKGRFTEDDIRNKKTNLLFFGNFHRMNLEEYNWAMNEMLKDREYLYNSMIKDIYYLGVVLAKKYRFLRISYTIFMWGFIASVIAFGIFVYYNSTTASSGGTAPLIDY